MLHDFPPSVPTIGFTADYCLQFSLMIFDSFFHSSKQQEIFSLNICETSFSVSVEIRLMWWDKLKTFCLVSLIFVQNLNMQGRYDY